MVNNLILHGNQNVTILKKPVMAITEEDKNKIKAAIDKWGILAKERVPPRFVRKVSIRQ